MKKIKPEKYFEYLNPGEILDYILVSLMILGIASIINISLIMIISIPIILILGDNTNNTLIFLLISKLLIFAEYLVLVHKYYKFLSNDSDNKSMRVNELCIYSISWPIVYIHVYYRFINIFITRIFVKFKIIINKTTLNEYNKQVEVAKKYEGRYLNSKVNIKDTFLWILLIISLSMNIF